MQFIHRHHEGTTYLIPKQPDPEDNETLDRIITAMISSGLVNEPHLRIPLPDFLVPEELRKNPVLLRAPQREGDRQRMVDALPPSPAQALAEALLNIREEALASGEEEREGTLLLYEGEAQNYLYLSLHGLDYEPADLERFILGAKLDSGNVQILYDPRTAKAMYDMVIRTVRAFVDTTQDQVTTMKAFFQAEKPLCLIQCP